MSTKISAGGVKKARNQGEKIVTANRLLDGVVVYLTREGLWTEDLAHAAIGEGDEALALLSRGEADAKTVVGPYLMDVDREEGVPIPGGRATLRESIRLSGPTIHPQFARTPAEEARHVSV